MTTPPPTLCPDMIITSLHIAWVFQAVASFPTAFVLGGNVFDNLLYSYYLNVYRFITYTFNGLFASGILFIILVQWSLAKRGALNLRWTFLLEVSKAGIATIMWTWLLLDSIFYDPPYYTGHRDRRIAVAATSVVLILVLFYPTAVYAAYARKTDDGDHDQESARRVGRTAPTEDESTPLLTERV
ncbi:hypothetical protein LTR84_010136 [Exophiala bonariae]|uniref:Integral membrane protein n=1 Tax=Exophiala bonariae TaxID=1690606 RepID=A0AAV9NPE6_9EURO|nr:hypothetical protein LTR84_010136 [Exophiala bonariae]